jgi:hypothetical protein
MLFSVQSASCMRLERLAFWRLAFGVRGAHRPRTRRRPRSRQWELMWSRFYGQVSGKRFVP